MDLPIAPGAQTLSELVRDPGEGSCDFAFVYSDKSGYDDYYELCLRLLRPGGLVAIDNTLWSGWVADPARDDADTQALRRLNQKIHDDERVEMCLLSIGDGLTLAGKR